MLVGDTEVRSYRGVPVARVRVRAQAGDRDARYATASRRSHSRPRSRRTARWPRWSRGRSAPPGPACARCGCRAWRSARASCCRSRSLSPGRSSWTSWPRARPSAPAPRASTANGKFDVSIKLTPAGRKLFKRTKKTLKVTLKGTFTPARAGQKRPQRGRDRHTQAMTRRLLTALIAMLAVSSQLPRRRLGVRPDHLHDAAGRAGAGRGRRLEQEGRSGSRSCAAAR